MEHGAGPPSQEDEGFDYETDTDVFEHEPPPEDAWDAVEAPIEPPPVPTETVVLSARLQAIVEAAEHSAEELRVQTEQRARERIAEADRAAEYRVHAAEEEAGEILAGARAQAEQAAAEAVNAVDSIHAEAHEALREAKATLAQARLDAEKAAKETVETARAQAREIVRAAHLATRDVMDDGSELSDQLRELSASLRTNAERLLRDIRLAHGSMTARLDQALPEGSAAPRPSRAARERDDEPPARRRVGRSGDSGPAVDFEVPDFIMGNE